MNDLYDYSVPALLRGLEGAKNIVTKSKEFAAEKGMTDADFLQLRLTPDMFPFVKQIQVVSDNAKGAVCRLSGTENPSYPDTEDSFDSLMVRVDATIAFIKSVSESAFEGAKDRKIVLPFLPTMYLTSHDYLQQFLLPNFYFHVTTAYDIARMVGVPLTKSDFANELSFKTL